ncbi:MAG: hypothetical protein QM756_19920 [Polyangiaceae bacterium]
MSAWIRLLATSATRSARHVILVLSCLVAVLSFARPASAFAWMVRHGYNQCTPCHADPSGAGTLTGYGRAIADEAIRMRFPDDDGEGEDSPPSAAFMWGAVELPKSLNLQGDVRYMRLEQKTETAPIVARNIWMQLDMSAALQLGGFVASASVGYAPEGALPAALTSGAEKNLISRYHWLGYGLLDGALLLRAGRMNLPFGLRTIEHTSWVRSMTRTSINTDQQYGVSAVYAKDRLRAEVMAVLGNFQLKPDDFRERGYSAYAEVALMPKLTLGASSLLTYRVLDPRTLRQTWRHAYGAFARYATPWEPLVLLAEFDYVFESPRYAPRRQGLVGFVQADVEFAQGMHLLGTGEFNDVGPEGTRTSYGGWLSYAWFLLPHTDLRIDTVYQRYASPVGDLDAVTLLLQGHVFL